MKNIETIYLDLDGPLLNGKFRHHYCYSKILNQHGFSGLEIEEYWNKKRALIDRKALLSLSGCVHLYDEFLAEWLSVIETREALSLDTLQLGALECLVSWVKAGKKIILVTLRSNKENTIFQLGALGLLDLLDDVLICDHSKGGLGKAEKVRDSCSKGLSLSKAIWVGDTEADWQAAVELCLPVYLVENGLRDKTALEGLSGVQLIPSISALTLV